MPSKLSSEKLAPNATVDETEKSYQRLLAFLDLASGSTFAIARCNLPLLRMEILQRVATDAQAKGVTVKVVDISSNYADDFVAAIKAGLDGTPVTAHLAVMVTGIDGLIYQSASQANLAGEGRTPFTARLNFNREYISHELPFPLVLWLESESLTLLLKQAPDFTQWISGHFQFGGPVAEAKALDQLMDSYKSLPSQSATETRRQLQEFSGLLQELNETRGREDAVGLRKRLAVLIALADRYYRLSNFITAQKYCAEAMGTAKKLNDRREEGRAFGNLGLTYSALGEMHQAIHHFDQSLAIGREIRDRESESAALSNLGIAYFSLGEVRRAIDYYEQSLAMNREAGDRHRGGQNLGNLGSAYLSLGETHRAIEYYERALAIHHEVGDHRDEGNTLCNLGLAFSQLGETRRAIEYFEQALKIFRDIGDRRGEGSTLDNMSLAYRRLGEPRRAIELCTQGLLIHRETGNRGGEGHALGALGSAYLSLGEPRRAVESYEQALAIHREIGDRRFQGMDLINMALALETLGDRDRAIANAEEALKIFEEIKDPNAPKVRQRLAEWRKG
jgi:tetratricopeptide (TPR) repeat protein